MVSLKSVRKYPKSAKSETRSISWVYGIHMDAIRKGYTVSQKNELMWAVKRA